MKHVSIDNPIINSPFEVPARHFRFDESGITDEIVAGRRPSSYFIPIAQTKKKGKQLAFETEWTQDRIEESRFINQVRDRVSLWRQGGYAGPLTPISRRLIEYWTREDRYPKLYFCQIEALETAIYLTEIAKSAGDVWIENALVQANAQSNPLLYRIAFKMATGSGKTAVMAMLIAWHAINKAVAPTDARFSDSFLVVSPGITIRDRLRVLLPSDTENSYRKLDLVPYELMDELGRAKIVITNFHAFKQREKVAAGKLTKAILMKGKTGESPFLESPAQMVRRVCRELGTKKNIVVLNDEAHHCYRHKPEAEVDDEGLKGDDRKEAEKREEEARIWISGIEAVKAKIGLRAVYDLSATPFFLKGSGYREGTLFPWVVSDFSLIDAIEAGVVKVPRVPVADDSMTGEAPTYRDLWIRIKDELPKKGRKTEAVEGEPIIPVELEGALQSLYANYEKYFRLWESDPKLQEQRRTPPVFIVVCNNTNVSNLVYRYISGWDKPIAEDVTVPVPGRLDLFSNVRDGRWLARPMTILVDSQQLESGEGMSDEFKQAAAREIEEFKHEYGTRFAGRDADALTDDDLLREVMNTVGQKGRLGEHVRCVVSVSMLTEGWDANTVTHVLGVRAFGTQLLCEQVVGRGLRRMGRGMETRTLTVGGESVEIETYTPEYAEVYGVPFSFIPTAGGPTNGTPTLVPTRVRAMPDREHLEITFPRITGYKYELPVERLMATFTDDHRLRITTEDLPTKTENAPIVGESEEHTIYGLMDRRMQSVAYDLARTVLERYFRDESSPEATSPVNPQSSGSMNPGRYPQSEGPDRPWLFPQLLNITREWMDMSVECGDNCFPQMLLFASIRHNAADKIYRAIVRSTEGERRLKPIPAPYDADGSTRYVDFDTTKPTYAADGAKSQISHVVLDSGWEAKVAQSLEEMPHVIAYAKNQNLGFRIPYVFDGVERSYYPDFLARMRKPDGGEYTLIIEVTGEKKKDKEMKVDTARELWVPAVNNDARWGEWRFVEVSDIWDVNNDLIARNFQ